MVNCLWKLFTVYLIKISFGSNEILEIHLLHLFINLHTISFNFFCFYFISRIYRWWCSWSTMCPYQMRQNCRFIFILLLYVDTNPHYFVMLNICFPCFVLYENFSWDIERMCTGEKIEWYPIIMHTGMSILVDKQKKRLS